MSNELRNALTYPELRMSYRTLADENLAKDLEYAEYGEVIADDGVILTAVRATRHYTVEREEN